MLSLAVDLGGTYLRCGVATPDGAMTAIERTKVPNSLDGATTPAAIWAFVVSHIDDYGRRSALLGADDPVAFAFPGPIIDGRTIVAAPTVTGDAAVPDLAAMLETRTGRRVFLLNDVSAAAWYLGQHLAVRRFMVVTVSSGIGAKVFDRESASGVIDDVAYAGEIGHCKVDVLPDAPMCDCGVRGHLGAIASGRGTLRLAQRMAQADPVRFAASRCVTAYGATAASIDNERHLVPAIKDGDEWAVDVMRRAMEPLARTLSASVYAFGLERIVVVGGFALEVGERYVSALRQLMDFEPAGSPFAMRSDDLVALGDAYPDATLLGAATYARRFLARTPVNR